ncbi:MAG: hypothetical protein RLZZ422_1609 [Pseudomonadota bacterium]|jgi:hypothetical protein
MVKRIILGAILLWSTMTSTWAAVDSKVDQTEVTLGDPIQLTISATNSTGVAPDLSALNKDFEIASTRQETQFSLVNGNGSQLSRWILSLYPRKSGKITIPALQVGSEWTKAIELTINDDASAATNQGQSNQPIQAADIVVEFEAEPKQAMVQQQMILTQRLLSSVRLESSQASLTLPQIESGKGILRQLGSPTSRVEKRNGKRYEVIERKFALMAQQSGTLTIGRTIFDGIIPDANPNNDPLGQYFSFSMGGKSVRRFSKPFDINVAPQDPTYTGKYWLPAKSLSLNASWDKPLDKLKAGEPVTLTIAIMAEGLASEQLPALDIPVPVGIKAYSDQPTLNDQVNDEGIIGIRQEKWVFIASGGGDFTIPEVTLDWWNTKTQQQELASLEAAPFKVGGEPLKLTEPAPTPKIEPPQATEAATVQTQTPTQVEAKTPWWLWGLLISFVGGVIAVIAYRHGKKQTSTSANALQESLKRGSFNHLIQACEQNDKQAAQLGLTAWARDGLGLPAPHWANLRAVASPELQSAMDDLEQALYSKAGQSRVWHGATLAKAVKDFKRPVLKANTPQGLMPLYPSS